MRHETVTVDVPGFDFKAAGYLVSIISVLLIGAVAWPEPSKPDWMRAALIAGMATSILGMALRYLDHVKDRKKQARRESRS